MPTEPGFRTYQQLLDAMLTGAMSLVEHLADAASHSAKSGRFDDSLRNFCWMSGLVRRCIVVSRYLDTVETPAEESHDKLMPALDWVLPFFAQHKIPLADYTAIVDGELAGVTDDGEEWSGDETQDVAGRRPIVLVAELCRDFGMAVHGLPTEWLRAVPDELRLFCARAAIAGIDFSKPPGRNSRRKRR